MDILKRFRDRESWLMILGNGIGLAVLFGLIDSDTGNELKEKGSETIGLAFMLMTNVGFMISRGIAKAGGAPSTADM
jgi:hypothetical protein